MPATPTRRPKPRVDESDLETEVEETPPKKKKKSKREKYDAKKKKQEAERGAARPTAAQSTTAPTFKEEDAFVPGMEWDDVPGNQKKAFLQARREFTKSGTAEAKAYKIESLRKQLKMAEKEQDELRLDWSVESRYYANLNKCNKNENTLNSTRPKTPPCNQVEALPPILNRIKKITCYIAYFRPTENKGAVSGTRNTAGALPIEAKEGEVSSTLGIVD